MLPISRILAPTDFSDRCRGILPYVRAVARKHGAEVILLHAVDPFYTIPPTAFSAPVVIPVSPSVIAEREHLMGEFAVSELKGLKVQRFVHRGDAVSEIVSFAQAEKVSLIAMPTHGCRLANSAQFGTPAVASTSRTRTTARLDCVAEVY